MCVLCDLVNKGMLPIKTFAPKYPYFLLQIFMKLIGLLQSCSESGNIQLLWIILDFKHQFPSIL